MLFVGGAVIKIKQRQTQDSMEKIDSGCLAGCLLLVFFLFLLLIGFGILYYFLGGL